MDPMISEMTQKTMMVRNFQIYLVHDILVLVEVIVLNRGTFIVSYFPVRISLLVNIIKIVVILVVVVVVQVVGDVGHHGEDGDRHGKEGHL